MRPSEDDIASAARTATVPGFPCGVYFGYRPNRAIYKEDLEGGRMKPFIPREDLASMFKSKVTSSGGLETCTHFLTECLQPPPLFCSP